MQRPILVIDDHDDEIEPDVDVCMEMSPEEFDALTSEEKGRAMRVMQTAVKASKRDFARISTFISPPKASATKKRESCRVNDLACLEMSQCIEILEVQKRKTLASEDAKRIKLDKEGPVIDVLVRYGFMQRDRRLTLDAMKAFICRNRSSFPHFKSSACKDLELELLIGAFTGPCVGRSSTPARRDGPSVGSGSESEP